MPKKGKRKLDCGGESDPSCNPEPDLDCGERPTRSLKVKHSAAFLKKANRILDEQEAEAPSSERKRFVHMLEWAAQRHEVFSKRWKDMMQREGDVLALINQAAKSGDTDEAVWRCFVAAHFGRTSSQDAHRIASSAKFLCAFGDSLMWTWECVSSDPKALRSWLSKNQGDLASLQFGNHRKFESPKPKLMWDVIKSFIDLVNEFDGPERLIDLDNDEKGDPFDVLYRRLRPLKRFGRTGRFDFLVLLSDLGLINAEPTKCYLQGATGPKDGAKLLWGDWTTSELDQAAAELAAGLAVSPHVMEDALCCWQK